MAKATILVIFLILVSLAIEKGHNNKNNPVSQFGPDDLEGFITAFLHGAKVELVSESTIPCKNSFQQFIIDSSESIDEIMGDQVWEGTLSLTDALGGTSFVARNCTNSVDEISEQFYNYINSFKSFESWINAIKDNVSKNLLVLSALSAQLVNEWEGATVDFARLGDILGQMAYYTLSSGVKRNSLTYLRSDPLAPAPMNEYVWMAFESAFEFLTNSQLVKEDMIVTCHNPIMNMLLFQMDAVRNVQASSVQEGIFLTLDSFVFLRPVVEQCTYTGLEIGENFNKVYNRIAENPELVRKNFEERLFHVVSGSAATYAQIYHRDIISLHRVFGGLVYNTLVRNEE